MCRTEAGIKMVKILSLGIYENDKKQYEVIGFILATNKFCKFKLSYLVKGNRRCWDIGAITEVESFRNIDEDNIEIIGDSKLCEYLTKDELKIVLKENKIDFNKSITNSSIRFLVVEPKIIKKIFIKNSKNYIEFISEGINKEFKIKDSRWIKYWEYILKKNNESLLKEKEIHYRDFLNSKDVFFVGYKETIDKRNTNYRYKTNDNYINITSVFWF